jgi:predicted RND superfamily exporter protein
MSSQDLEPKSKHKFPLEESEPFLERFLFGHRPLVIIVFSLLTLFMLWQAIHVKPDASFEKMIPTGHPFISNFLEDREDLKGLGNLIRIAVETSQDDIFEPEFLDTLKQITDETFFIPGVDRTGMKSLWTPNMRWIEVTEEGLTGGPVIPNDYDGSDESIEQVRKNVFRSGQVGRLIANDFKSTIILVPLLELDPATGERLDYRAFSTALEKNIRNRFQNENIRIHITGFAKIVGDLIDGAAYVATFFAVACVITLTLLLAYSHCIKSSVIVLICSLIAVVWQLGLLNLMGYGLDPYSMLIPFLVFAIAVSHGVQIFNAIVHGSMVGMDSEKAARYAFRSLYIAGLTALISDGIGFTTLLVIEITVIRDLAVAASIGVAVIILTNLVLLPVTMSFAGVNPKAVQRLKAQESGYHSLWKMLAALTGSRQAPLVIAVAVLLFGYGLAMKTQLKIGDLEQGAPELRADSRYNIDSQFISEHYSASTDVFVVMAHTPPNECISYGSLATVDYFQWYLQSLPGVQSVVSMVDRTKRVISALNEGNLKWMAISRNQLVLNGTVSGQQEAIGLINADCSMMPILVFLEDHKAETLRQLVDGINAFNLQYDTGNVELRMAAGNAGIEAATNIVVEDAQYEMLVWVYSVVSLLVFLAFRSWRTVVCIIVPLALTSVLGQALMVHLDIGVKVATLPVIALGIGIGVDYGIYIYSKLETLIVKGADLREAYFMTLITTGKAVIFTGITLAIGVATWVLSPIKFQADMGIMLTFMFLWNMLGAVLLLPALARYLIDTDKLSRSTEAVEHSKLSNS